MQINNKKLKIQANIIKKNIEDYVEEYYSLYSSYKNFLRCWNDGQTESFSELIKDEKQKIDIFFNDLFLFCEKIKSISTYYSKIGNRLNLIENTDGDIVRDYEIINKKILKIEKIMEDINTNLINNRQIINSIGLINKKINTTKQNILKSKKEYTEAYNFINETEEQIKKDLSKTNIIRIKENGINMGKLPTIRINSSKIGFFDNYAQILKIIKIITRDEILYHQKITESFEKIESLYKSENNKEINNKIDTIINNFQNIHQNHISYITFLDEKIKNQIDTTRKAKEDIKNIGD